MFVLLNIVWHMIRDVIEKINLRKHEIGGTKLESSNVGGKEEKNKMTSFIPRIHFSWIHNT